jgi:antitoxin (DNA-binding transcriptional repressor) of toxin-antitoxin stability system
MNATLDELEKRAADYLKRVLRGETGIVFRDGRPVA